ncbi:MAG: AAA family ATPase [Endomicrobium sp.]|jgi:hypothetical protein|nr:AAA family ATPase [Endomicrobium sp.]
MKIWLILIQTFEKLHNKNAVSIYNLTKYGGYYFLSRLRRFGKSMLLSTMKHLFLGNKELLQEGVEQIRDRKYYKSYVSNDVVLLAIAFGKEIGCKFVRFGYF